MPEITNDTPRSDITVAGKTFSVPQPYAAGHSLNANEASALNQTYAENVRNNMASKVKEADEAGTFDQDVFQGRLNDYCETYEFGVRTGGGRSGDPVLVEAMAIARDLVRKALSKQGHKVSEIAASKISELAKGVLNRNDDKSAAIMATARQRVEAAQELDVDVETDSLDSGDEPTAAATPRRSRASAEATA